MKLIILDRDGVINHDSMEYIKSPQEWLPIDGSLEAIAKLTSNGYTVAVATNQSGIARGLYDEPMLERIHDKRHQMLAAHGGAIDNIWYCPHMPDSGCDCRKPKPGMLKAIAKHYQCVLDDVFYVGDRIADIQAAIAACAIPIHVSSPMTKLELLPNYPEVMRFASLHDVVESLFD